MRARLFSCSFRLLCFVLPLVTGAGVAQAFTVSQAGNHTGLVARDATLNGQLGGRISYTVTRFGQASGSLRLNGRKYPFRVTLQSDLSDPSGFQATVLLPRSRATPLWLTLKANGGSLREAVPGAPSIPIFTCHCPSYRTGDAGRYNVGFNSNGSLAEGFARLTIGKTGRATWAGRAGDGSPFTSASRLGSRRSTFETVRNIVGLHARLDKDQGSLQGFFQLSSISGPALDVDSLATDLPLDLYLRPRSGSSKDRTFPGGVATTSLTAIGQRYDRSRHVSVHWAPSDSPAPSAYLSFFGRVGGNPAPFNQYFRLLPPAKLIMPRRGSTNPNGVSLRLSPSTGLFSGRYVLNGIGHKGRFYGLLVNHRTMPFSSRGFGHYRLSQNPADPFHVGTVRWMDALP